MIIMWFFMENLAMGLVFMVIAIVFGFLFATNSSKIKKLLSDNIISGVLKEVLGETMDYNPEEAYYILTPHMMEYILSMADKSGGEVYMSFLRDGKMQIAVRTDRDFFELGKSKVNVEKLREKFLCELRWFLPAILD